MRCEESERQTRVRAAVQCLHDRDRATLRFDLDGLTISRNPAATEFFISAAKSARFRARRRAQSLRFQAA